MEDRLFQPIRFLVPFHQGAFDVGCAVQNLSAHLRVWQYAIVTVVQSLHSIFDRTNHDNSSIVKGIPPMIELLDLYTIRYFPKLHYSNTIQFDLQQNKTINLHID